MQFGGKEHVAILSSMVRIGFSEKVIFEQRWGGKGLGYLKEQLMEKPDVKNKAGVHEVGLGWRGEFGS